MAGFEIAREDSVQEVLTDTKQVNTLLGNIDDPAGEASVVALLRLLSQGILATGVKSVQRLYISQKFTSDTEKAYTISTVNPDKVIVYFIGMSQYGTSDRGNGGYPNIVRIEAKKIVLNGFGTSSTSYGCPYFSGSIFVIEFF